MVNHLIINKSQLSPTMWDNINSGDTISLNLGEIDGSITIPAIPNHLTNITFDASGTIFKTPTFVRKFPKRIKHHPLTDFFKY